MSETTETTQVEETTTAETVETTDLAAEVEKWKSLSRKNEQQAKANAQAAKELEELKRSQLTDTEKLIETTKEETRRAVQQEFSSKLVDAELKAALNGRVLEGESLLDFNRNSFISETGDIDTASIQTWVEAHSKPATVPVPDLGQGARGITQNSSLIRSREELSHMTPAEILAAKKDGRLDALLGKI